MTITKAHRLSALMLASAYVLTFSLAHAEEALAIVDTKGYITPHVDLETSADVRTQTNDGDTVLMNASGSANTQVQYRSVSSKHEQRLEENVTAGTASEDEKTYASSTEPINQNWFARLRTWGKLLFSLLGFTQATTTVDGGVTSTATTSVNIKTTPTTAHLNWNGSSSLVTRIYYSSSTPVSSSSPYITVWGMTRQEAELNHLSPNTTYFYRIVPLGVNASASTTIESWFTTATQ